MNKVKKHFNKIAKNYDYYKKKNKFYYDNLKKILSGYITTGKDVLEVGCGTGDLISYLEPKYGYGMDLSGEMIRIAKGKHKKSKNLHFSTKYPKDKKFDYIFMSDVIEHLEKPEIVFSQISKILKRDGLFINTTANPLWEPILMLAEKFALKMPEGPHCRITAKEYRMLIKDYGMKIIKQENKLLIPIYIPFFSNLVNNYLEKYLKKYAFTQILVAKKR